MKRLTVALAIYNEASRIGDCLDAVQGWADEIVIVDGGSTDGSLDVVKGYGVKLIRTDNPPIFHINKQKALDASTGQWILQLDADEIVTPELRREIDTITTASPSAYAGYYVARKNYFVNHWLRKGGLYPDYVIRLLRKGRGYFPCKSVHEQIVIDGKVGYLEEALIHRTYASVTEYWRKADTYTTLTAAEFRKRNVPVSPRSALTYLVLSPLRTFFDRYIRHKGILDGYYGFLFALFSAMHDPIAYDKYRKGRGG